PPFFLSILTTFRSVPSFPTRRSSDLICAFGVDAGKPRIAMRLRLSGSPMQPPGGLPNDRPGYIILRCCYGMYTHISVDDCSQVLDRKSTRLNSSHVKISYAVFCLKKK